VIIDNIEQIEHPQLVKDIKSLCLELSNVILSLLHSGYDSLEKSSTWDSNNSFRFKQCDTIIRDHILGINRPICIVDGAVYALGKDLYQIELLVDYRITYGYKPNQSLDKGIHLFCQVSKEIMRDHKINELCHI